VLPPGPREYWNQLAQEHQTVPEHQQWMYDSDPFRARKMVDERQAKVAKAQAEEDARARKRDKPVKNEFTDAPEVRMAISLREKTEEAIKLVRIYTLGTDFN
jgi:ATP-dependent RNA helicase DHX57